MNNMDNMDLRGISQWDSMGFEGFSGNIIKFIIYKFINGGFYTAIFLIAKKVGKHHRYGTIGNTSKTTSSFPGFSINIFKELNEDLTRTHMCYVCIYIYIGIYYRDRKG